MRHIKKLVRSEIANRWSGEKCQLDGETAKVTGRLNECATIASLESENSDDYSWDAVERIMNGDQLFERRESDRAFDQRYSAFTRRIKDEWAHID